MPDDTAPQKARIIKASTLLQAKVGTGTIDEEKIRKMQQVLDQTKVDFAPLAMQLLDELSAAIQRAKDDADIPAVLIAQMTVPVMQIKAHAAMFDYAMVGRLANVALDFLENVTATDKTVIEIIEAHHKALAVIVKNKMSGNAGDYGTIMEKELKEACSRYFTKKSTDAFFVG
ncbi:MAG: hypothetical protein ACXW4B_08890 [Micavibrio sp.]